MEITRNFTDKPDCVTPEEWKAHTFRYHTPFSLYRVTETLFAVRTFTPEQGWLYGTAEEIVAHLATIPLGPSLAEKHGIPAQGAVRKNLPEVDLTDILGDI